MNYVIVPIGSRVQFGKFYGHVNSATIANDGVVYRVAYWNDDEYEELSLFEHEFIYSEEKYLLVTEK